MIIWLASYPKSGNTWMRSLISTYLTNSFDNPLTNIYKISAFPKKEFFKDLIDENTLKKNPHKIFNYFIKAQEKYNLNKKLRFLKTHNAWISVEKNGFTDVNNTLGSIYLIRDPRSVLVSYSHHANLDFEKSLDVMLKKDFMGINDNFYLEARSSWNLHVKTWISNPLPKIIIKYEDLIKNTYGEFLKVLKFINTLNSVKIIIDETRIHKTIKACSFDNLSHHEKKFGFKEALHDKEFFRKGQISEWEKKLPMLLINKINKEFKNEMKIFNYL